MWIALNKLVLFDFLRNSPNFSLCEDTKNKHTAAAVGLLSHVNLDFGE